MAAPPPSPRRVSTEDEPLKALLLPFENGALAWPQGRVLCRRGRDGGRLRRIDVSGLRCVQGSRPLAEALQRAGVEVVPELDDDEQPASLVLVLPPRQREEARALLARAVDLAAPGARVVAAVSNDEGARSREKDLQQLAGMDGHLTKFHCRVFWTPPLQGPADAALAAQWRGGDAVRPLLGGRFRSRPGVFAWDRIDAASALLAAKLPADLRGRAAGVGALDLYEAEFRALELARRNLEGARITPGFHWHDVTAGLPRDGYDFIVSNPPFHAHDRGDRPELGQRFIEVAAQALRPG